VEQNQYGGVTGSYVVDVQFDGNTFVGGGYSAEGVTLTGHRGTTAAFRADSFDIREGGWLYLSSFDSLLIDAAQVRQTDYYGAQLYNGRVAVVQNTTFRDLWDTGIYFAGRGEDSSTVLVRNTLFQGRASTGDYYYYYGYGIETYYATLDAQDVVFRGLYAGSYNGYGAVRLRRVTFDDVGYGLYAYCVEGPSTVDSVTVRGSAYESVYLYGCRSGAPATVVVDSLDVADDGEGAYLYDIPRLEIRRSRFSNVYSGVYADGDTVVLDALDVSAYGGWGIEAYVDSLGSLTGSRHVDGAGECGQWQLRLGIPAELLPGSRGPRKHRDRRRKLRVLQRAEQRGPAPARGQHRQRPVPVRQHPRLPVGVHVLRHRLARGQQHGHGGHRERHLRRVRRYGAHSGQHGPGYAGEHVLPELRRRHRVDRLRRAGGDD
jgi:hypothetical protein